MSEITPLNYEELRSLMVAAGLFVLGAIGFLTRRNLILLVCFSEPRNLREDSSESGRPGVHDFRSDSCCLRSGAGSVACAGTVPPDSFSGYQALVRAARVRCSITGLS